MLEAYLVQILGQKLKIRSIKLNLNWSNMYTIIKKKRITRK